MKFAIAGKDFLKDGKPVKIISGAVHYFRNLPDTWDDIFGKLVALGCNTVETYCAWNIHEKRMGEFDFSGILNVAEFLKKAQEFGLMAIVRPGPYICAEWEFGGLPWWLQTLPEMEIRCSNPVYMGRFKLYLQRLFEEVRPLLFTNGGNVIMMQVENEYGYYGDDNKYLSNLVAIYRENGIDVPLFTSDGTKETDILDGNINGCLATLNFGSRVEENFKAHDKLFPDSPKMCMECWNGWFDAWGDDKHHTTPAEDYAKVIDDMLKRGSVNMYMFIGGTNFGFTSGANHYEKFAPDVTSYDYDALLTECGDVTEKYYAVREVIKKYIDYELPSVPENRGKQAYGKVALTESAGLFENLCNLSAPQQSEVPKCMEEYGSGYGYILYRTILNRDYENAALSFERIGDRAHIFIDDKLIGILYVNDEELKINISARAGSVLSVLVENMGRTNFGPKMMYKKGIAGRCLLDGKIHFGWEAYTLPMDNLAKLKFSGKACNAPAFYRGVFNVIEREDTFLLTDNFKKGLAVINGFNLGRYWEIGPQKTLYVPKSVLKEGENEILIFETDGLKGKPIIEFTDKPDLG